LKGKFVLINFFATWCGPCKIELPKIQSEIWNKHKDNPKFAMLTFGREHSWQEVEKFKQANGFQFSFYPDPKRGVYGKFATQTIPRSILLDEEGKIIFLSEGFEESHFNELVKLIDSKL
jgi:thiol-disulfide isomerase/thioredoxin